MLLSVWIEEHLFTISTTALLLTASLASTAPKSNLLLVLATWRPSITFPSKFSSKYARPSATKESRPGGEPKSPAASSVHVVAYGTSPNS